MVLIKWLSWLSSCFSITTASIGQNSPGIYVSQLKLAIGEHSVEAELPTKLQGHSTKLQPYQVLGTRVIEQEGEQVQ